MLMDERHAFTRLTYDLGRVGYNHVGKYQFIIGLFCEGGDEVSALLHYKMRDKAYNPYPRFAE
jgi:hypothetical protein